MTLSLISSPRKTINGLLSKVNAGRSQLPYEFYEDDIQPGYKVEVQIWDKDNTTQLVPITFRYAPEANGRLFINVGQILANIQEFGLYASLEYVFKYRPSWEGSDEPWTSLAPVQSLYAKKQIGLLGGSNMWEYLLREELGKLLTKFKNPVMWRGWNRTVAFVIDSEIGNRIDYVNRVYVNFRGADVNKSGSDLIESRQVATPDYSVYIEIIPENNTSKQYYTWIEVKDSSAVAFISEKIYYKVEDECHNPVMVQWLNSLGAPEQHLFTINQEVNIEASPGLAYEKTHTQDQEQIYADKARISSKKTQSMLLTAQDLTNDQISALAEIKTSPNVEVFLTKDGSKKVGVICRDALSTPYDSKGTRQEFRLAIEFPNDFDFYEAKQY